MKNFYFMMAVCCLMLSCSSSEDDADLGNDEKVVNMLPKTKPISLTPEQRVFVQDNNQFTLSFLKTVNETERSGKGFIYSPLSITYVLGMVNDAATGLTEKELEETLGFHEGGIQAVNEYCKKLIDGLPKADQNVTLNIANAIFLNKDFTLKPQFQQDMQTYYDAKAEALDFRAPETLDHINGWCSEKTNGMVPSILNDVDPSMVSYLLNAIYFKANWTSKFDENNTRNEDFTTPNGTVQLPMMHQNVLINYLKNSTYSAIKMPYGSGVWNMVIMMPEEGKTVNDIIDHLMTFGIYPVAYDDIGENLNAGVFSPYEVDVKLPRYETSSDTNDLAGGLVGLMQKMGINRAFHAGLAEIPNMANTSVYISMMRQKAKIKVNEKGAETAAVTVAGGDSAFATEYPKATFHANHPFIYVITEASTGVILFVGKFTGA